MKAFYLTFLIVLIIESVNAQKRGERFELMLGGQAVYGFVAEPVARDLQAGDFFSGASASYGLGAVVGASLALNTGLSLSSLLSIDVHRFSYDLIGPQTFGEDQGRVVQGRYLTAFKGVAIPAQWSFQLEAKLGTSSFRPFVFAGGGFRYFLKEHSNADAAYLAGYQRLSDREAARTTLAGLVGLGVAPEGSSSHLSLTAQHALEQYSPLQNSLVLRLANFLSRSGKGIACPTF